MRRRPPIYRSITLIRHRRRAPSLLSNLLGILSDQQRRRQIARAPRTERHGRSELEIGALGWVFSSLEKARRLEVLVFQYVREVTRRLCRDLLCLRALDEIGRGECRRRSDDSVVQRRLTAESLYPRVQAQLGARVVALLQVALFVGMGLGSATWGALAGAIGLSQAMGVSGAAMMLSLLLSKLAPLTGDEEPDLAPLYPDIDSTADDCLVAPVVTRVTYRVPSRPDHHGQQMFGFDGGRRCQAIFLALTAPSSPAKWADCERVASVRYARKHRSAALLL